MANLDTPLKRLSGINVSSPWRAFYPLPDGTIDSSDRPASMFLYALPATAPAITVTVTGTAVGATEADIRAGGNTIILTVTNDTWVSGAAFDAQRATMILNLYGDQVGATAWNAIVRATEPDTAVVRTSDTVITITLSAHPTYDISVTENITPTIDNALLTNGTIPLQTDPTTFPVTPVVEPVTPPAAGGGPGGGQTWQHIKPGGQEPKRRRNLRDEPAVARRPHRPEDSEPQPTPREVAEVLDAKAQAENLSQQIIEARREISRIKTQMRLSSNEAALKVMADEIQKIEADLARTKREAEDMLLLTLLM